MAATQARAGRRRATAPGAAREKPERADPPPKPTAHGDRPLRVFAYDIADDKKRARVAKVLEAVGDRVQYSVFCAALDDAAMLHVLHRIEKRIDRASDRVHVYTLCAHCAGRVRTAGADLPVAPEFDLF